MKIKDNIHKGIKKQWNTSLGLEVYHFLNQSTFESVSTRHIMSTATYLSSDLTVHLNHIFHCGFKVCCGIVAL